jgi:hypothetical protein
LPHPAEQYRGRPVREVSAKIVAHSATAQRRNRCMPGRADLTARPVRDVSGAFRRTVIVLLLMVGTPGLPGGPTVRGMGEVGTRRRPGVALLGYGTTLLIMVATVACYQNQALDGLGWHGGDYADLFLALTGFAVLAGAVLWSRPPGSPWRSFGFGMVLGGLTGGVFVVLIMVLVGIALSHTTIPF